MVERAVKGSCPVNSSNAITPSAYTSVRASMVPSSHCSGAMYSGVPTSTPAWVLPCREPRSLAMPKSTSFTRCARPRRETRKTFSGLRSRCTTPCSWAAASASQSWSRIAIPAAGSTGPRRSSAASVSPSRYSIT